MSRRHSDRALGETTVMPGAAPAGDEAEVAASRQRLRIRRFQMGSLFSVLYLLVLAIFSTQGKVDRLTLIVACVMVGLLILAFYGVFRSGLNLRFSDPSLTGWQLTAAVSVMLIVVYRAPEARLVFTAFFFIALMFGMLRMSSRRLTVMGALAIAGYGFTIALRYARDEDGATLGVDALLLAVIALTYPWFVYVGRQVRRIERGLLEVTSVLDDVEDEAVRDELTGVPNRRALNRAMEEAKRRSDGSLEAFSICFIDLDHFKRYNDELGHLSGDEVLRAFTRAALVGQRTGDIFGRYGGEEFLQILRETDLDGALVEAERLRARVSALDLPAARAVGRLTISIGVAQYRRGEKIVEMFARADAALQRAKRGGRNRVAT